MVGIFHSASTGTTTKVFVTDFDATHVIDSATITTALIATANVTGTVLMAAGSGYLLVGTSGLFATLTIGGNSTFLRVVGSAVVWSTMTLNEIDSPTATFAMATQFLSGIAGFTFNNPDATPSGAVPYIVRDFTALLMNASGSIRLKIAGTEELTIGAADIDFKGNSISNVGAGSITSTFLASGVITAVKVASNVLTTNLFASGAVTGAILERSLTTGTIFYSNGTIFTTLAMGANGQVLQVVGSTLVWSTV